MRWVCTFNMWGLDKFHAFCYEQFYGEKWKEQMLQRYGIQAQNCHCLDNSTYMCSILLFFIFRKLLKKKGLALDT